jgi:hypothetical protein
MLPIIFSVPSGLPQRMQPTTVASLSTRGALAAGSRLKPGRSVIAVSGHVAAQIPHCTQRVSMKRNCGVSCESVSAPTGQLPTQARLIVHASRSTSIAPNGAPVGNGMRACGVGAWVARCSIAMPSVVRFSAVAANVAATRGASAGGQFHNPPSNRAVSASTMRKCSPW